MPFHKCMRMAPFMGRHLAVAGPGPCSPWWPAMQPLRGLFTPWSRTPDIGALVRDMDRQMDRMERQMFRGLPAWFQRPNGPNLLDHAVDDTRVDGHQYRMAVDLAGFKPEEIELALDESGRRLTISAKCERTGRDGSRFAQEVSRTVTLPETIDTDALTTLLHHDGVLAIEAPFKEQARQPEQEPRSIPITRASGATAAVEDAPQQQPLEQDKKADSSST